MGEGTLITTEQCLLNPNRNRHLGKTDIEQILDDYLGVDTVIWLPYGHSLDTGATGTDGHIDGVAQYVAPGRVLLEVPESEESTEFARVRADTIATGGGGPHCITQQIPAGLSL